MRTARRDTLFFVVLLTATLTLSGCAGKHWYWPFGKKAQGTPTATLASNTNSPAGYETDTNQGEVPPPVPPVAELPSGQSPSTIAGPGNVVPPDSTESIPEAPEIRKPSVMASELKMVHFDYDHSQLSADAKHTLDNNVEWLLQHPGIQVQIEGHCDERGTVEYNLALGQRRADSVRQYLVSKGIDPNSLHTISYGKERPLAFGNTQADHAMNRRAQFLIFSD